MWTTNLLIQYFAWFLALIQAIIGLYIFYLNPRQANSRQTVLLLLVQALNSYGIGSLSGASSTTQASLPALLIAVTAGARLPLMLITALLLLRPKWMRRPSFSLVKIGLFAIAAAPLVLTLVDSSLGSGLYYTGFSVTNYRNGFVEPSLFLQGTWYAALNLLTYTLPGILLLIFLAYEATLDRSLRRSERLLVLIILLAGLVTQASGLLVGEATPFLATSLVSSTIVLTTLAYATYQELIGDRRQRAGSLVTRLAVIALIIALPLLGGMAIFLTNQARNELENDAVEALASSNRAATASVEVWLNSNNRALKMLTLDDDMISMNPALQQPVLKSFVVTYPYIYLASTTNQYGVNVSRSDDRGTLDYSDRAWFKNALSGRPLSSQVEAVRASGTASLIFAVPIRDETSQVKGVLMFATELDDLARLVAESSFVGAAQVFLVDDRDYVLTHTNAEIKATTYYKDYPAVKILRAGKIGATRFTDDQGVTWRAHVNVLSNGWGLVVQQEESTLFAPIRSFQSLGVAVMFVGGLTLLVLIWSALRQSLRPVETLTSTAKAISAGDISRIAPVESQDELGTLAEAFNTMTAQMRDLISGLENRVAERTRDVERRALQLQVTAEVAREAAAIRDPDRLLYDVTRLVSNRLGHYHVGIFFIEGARTSEEMRGGEPDPGYAVLKAANSEGGQQMLERGHRLKVGQTGIVGYVAGSGRPRIALDVGHDAVYFNNPYLPLTRSEVALPLKIQDQVIGVLDVQSRKAQAFNEDDLAILQILADQVALAIENARLIAESQQTVRELENLYGMQVAQGWQRRLGDQPLVYHVDASGVQQVAAGALSQAGDDGSEPAASEYVMQMPIELRGRKLGRLLLRRTGTNQKWAMPEKQLLRDTAVQLAQSLENARLLEEIQKRARQEEQLNQIVARTQSSLNLETVMRTAVQELAQTLNISRVRLRLDSKDDDQAKPANPQPENGQGGRA